MSLKVFKLAKFDYTHENEQFSELVDILKKKFDSGSEQNLLFGNINFQGVPLDALFVKRDAIIVLEFKNYGGTVVVSENGDWKLEDKTIVKGGAGKNPFMQTRTNKFAVVDFFNTWFPKSYVNLGHISGIVVFRHPMTIDSQRMSPRSRSWFHITDMCNIGQKIDNIASPGINYSEKDLYEIPKMLNCDDVDYLEYETPNIDTAILDSIGTIPNQPETPVSSTQLSDLVRKFLIESEYEIFEKDKPGKSAQYHNGLEDLGNSVVNYANRIYNGQLYEHQYAAVKAVSDGKNVCITTSTNSGKSAIFHMAALTMLERDPNARILAIYPMKALGTQQVRSWQEKMGDNIKCGRIDGNVRSIEERIKTLRECQVVVFTPDTIHTFLLGKANDDRCFPAIHEFLFHLKLIVVDEIHIYTGILGSNSAYMFRRLNSCIILSCGSKPQYIASSATLRDPVQHAKDITGADDFEYIGQDLDTSPSCHTKIFMVKQKTNQINLANFLTNLTQLLPEDCKTITFTDSRKKTTEVANETDRALNLQGIGIYPFKSGLEDEDYNTITNVLQSNDFRGVVSTSSLEVGIDISTLNVAVLDGIPNNTTSFYQRIGRVGRGSLNKESVVIILYNPNSIVTRRLFDYPGELLKMSPEEPALYLDNVDLMTIQAIHFVGNGNEFQSFSANNHFDDYKRIENAFPEKFNALCKGLLNNQDPDPSSFPDYVRYSDLGGENPEFTFTIRQFDIQFNVHVIDENDNENRKGTLSIQNILREAYKGAIYSYLRDRRRVLRIDRQNHEVILSRECCRMGITTKPIRITYLYPQKNSSLYRSNTYGHVTIVNMAIHEKTQITGYKEIQGNTENTVNYAQPFTHLLRTKGVVICHPVLSNNNIMRSYISMLLYECFLSYSAFERADIEWGTGILNTDIGGAKANSPFITIYDKAKDGLNITSRLMDKKELEKGFKEMVNIIDRGHEDEIIGKPLNDITKLAIRAMYDDIATNEEDSNYVSVSRNLIAPNSKAFYQINSDNNHSDMNSDVSLTEVTILSVIFNTREQEYQYMILNHATGERKKNVSEGAIKPIKDVSEIAIDDDGFILPTGQIW